MEEIVIVWICRIQGCFNCINAGITDRTLRQTDNIGIVIRAVILQIIIRSMCRGCRQRRSNLILDIIIGGLTAKRREIRFILQSVFNNGGNFAHLLGIGGFRLNNGSNNYDFIHGKSKLFCSFSMLGCYSVFCCFNQRFNCAWCTLTDIEIIGFGKKISL